MSNKSGKRNFIVHGGILAMAGILVRIIGMLYRIPMANILGEDGSAIYTAAFNIYNIVLVLSSYGLPMSVSKLVASRIAVKQYRNAHKVFVASIIISLVSGGIAALLLFFGAGFLEKYLYTQASGISIPLRVLAPTIFFVAVLGVFRGFYQGQGTTIPTAISQLAEQIMNAIVSIAACYMLVNLYKDSLNVGAYGAAGGTFGTAMGALTALLFVVFVYVIYRPTFIKKMSRDVSSVSEDYLSLYKIIGLTMLPIILGQTAYQISAVIDDIMFLNIMGTNGSSEVAIKGVLGNYNMSFMTLIGLPMGVASAMSASLLPSIVASRSLKLYVEIRDKINKTVKANMFIAIPSFVGLVVLGESIIQLIFPRFNSVQGGMMLKIGAIAVVFYTLSTVTSTALQGIDKMNLPVIHSCISLVFHIVIVWTLLKFTDMGIYSVVIGNVTFPMLIMILNLIALSKYIHYKQEIIKTFAIPFVCALVMGAISGLTYKLFMNICGINALSLVFALVAAGIGYFTPIILFKKKGMY